MQAWEYLKVAVFYDEKGTAFYPSKTVQVPDLNQHDDVDHLPDLLDALGSQGWELVNAQQRTSKANTIMEHYYFKRPIE